MTKEEFAEELRKRGYNAKYAEKTVIVIREGKSCFRELKKIAKALGYDMSFSWRAHERRRDEAE